MNELPVEGQQLGSVSFPVERSKLAELARALHDDDPVWSDEAAARAAGFDGIPMLPTVTVIADHWREHGALQAAVALGANLERLLHGEVSWRYLRPPRVGEELTASTHVANVSTREGRRGGLMTIVTIETAYTNGAGEAVAQRRDSLIETGDPA